MSCEDTKGCVTLVNSGDNWVDFTAKVINKYKDTRGANAGSYVEMPGGSMAHMLWVPATRCGDIVQAFDGWASEIMEKLGRSNAYGIALWKLKLGLLFGCLDEAHTYPKNDVFWNLVRRSAIELDSMAAKPPQGWDLLLDLAVEEGSNVADKLQEGLKNAGKLGASAIWWMIKPIAIPALIVGAAYYYTKDR